MESSAPRRRWPRGAKARAASPVQALLLKPALDHRGDLEVVAIHHHQVRVAAHAGLRQVDHVDLAAGLADGVAESDAVLADLRPARVLLDVIAVEEERGNAL